MIRRLLAIALAVLWPASAWALNYGDYAPGSVIDFTITTLGNGIPATLSGSPVVKVYKANSTTTETTVGVTLDSDWDGVTGLAHIRVDTSADGTFYAAGNNFNVVITTGTVAGVSFVGYTVGSFSLNATSALRPTTAGRTLDVSAGGEAGVDWANVGSPSTTVNLSGTTIAAVSSSSDPWATSLPGTYTGSQAGAILATRAASGATVTLSSPVATGNLLTIKQGDDYSATDNVPIDFSYSGSFDPSSPTSITLRIYTTTTEVAAFTGTVIGSASPWTLRFQPTAAQTAALTPSTGYRYDIEVVKNARKRTLVEAACTVSVN